MTLGARELPRLGVTVLQVMETLTVPASDVIFDAAYETPTTDETWKTVQNSALALAESGKLLLTPDRESDQEWRRQTQSLIDTALLAAKAAESKNGDRLTEAADKIYLTCDSCHDLYTEK